MPALSKRKRFMPYPGALYVPAPSGGSGADNATTGLVGLWNMKEGSGSTFNDTSGLGHNATVTSPNWSGTDASFSGSMYGTIADNAVFHISPNLTVFIWINKVNGTGGGVVGRTVFDIDGRGWAIQNADSVAALQVDVSKTGINDGNRKIYVSSLTSVDASWHSFAFVHTGGGTGALSLYVDGVLDTSPTPSVNGDTASIFENGRPIIIGAFDHSSSGPFSPLPGSLLSGLRIYNISKSATGIAAIHALGRP